MKKDIVSFNQGREYERALILSYLQSQIAEWTFHMQNDSQDKEDHDFSWHRVCQTKDIFEEIDLGCHTPKKEEGE